jgi:glycosyltransferase involved in cell wall biosynthesis
MQSDAAEMQRESVAIFPLADATHVGSEGARSATERLDALFLLNALNVGGSERKIVRLANELTARGMRVGLVTLNEPDTLASMLDPAVPRWRLDRRGKFSMRTVRALSDIVSQRRPRVMFCVNMYPTLYAVGMSLALRERAPQIIGLINTTDFGPRERWRQRFYTYFLKRLDWLVYGCELQRDAWSRRSPRLRTQAQTIYNGVDVQEFSPHALQDDRETLRQRAGYTPNTFVVGSVGRLVPAKNQKVLIDSVAILRDAGIDARLIVAGEGPLRESLEQHASARGVAEFVRFTGPVPDVRPLLAMFDVFVLPSLYVETFSNAALEAMAMRTPLILSRVGGAAEMIREGDEGFLIEPEDLPARLPALLQQLAADPDLRARMAAKARQRVEREFSFHYMVEQYAGLIQRFAV